MMLVVNWLLTCLDAGACTILYTHIDNLHACNGTLCGLYMLLTLTFLCLSYHPVSLSPACYVVRCWLTKHISKYSFELAVWFIVILFSIIFWPNKTLPYAWWKMTWKIINEKQHLPVIWEVILPLNWEEKFKDQGVKLKHGGDGSGEYDMIYFSLSHNYLANWGWCMVRYSWFIMSSSFNISYRYGLWYNEIKIDSDGVWKVRWTACLHFCRLTHASFCVLSG